MKQGNCLRTEEHKKISIKNLKKAVEFNKGKHRSEETKQKLRIIHKGKSYHNKGFQKGHKSFLTPEKYKEIGKKLKAIGHKPKPCPMPGDKHWNWKGGVSKERLKDCNSKEYREWRAWIFKRDNFTCQKCGKIGGSLNAHHLIYWSEKPTPQWNYRYDRENGLTLCERCHRLIHTKKYKEQFCCRWSPTLGDLEDTHEKIWGTRKYAKLDKYNPTVFFGIYSLKDFFTLWEHRGERYILWAGGDILRMVDGYWLDDIGEIKVNPKDLASWITQECKSYVENQVEHDKLLSIGIKSEIIPSFLGDINKFPKSDSIKTDKKRYYASVSGDNFEQYGWQKIGAMAWANKDTEYHLYGNKGIFVYQGGWPDNVFIHGRVPKEQMNEEIKSMTGCIRLVDFDGFSEVVAKAVLMGQEVISAIDYPFLKAENPREELLKVLNRYPWNNKLQK